MFNISEYLQKFAKIEGDMVFQKRMISKALKEVCDLDGVEFEMKKGTLFVKADPVIKSIVFMKKKQLEDYLKKNYPKAVSDIR